MTTDIDPVALELADLRQQLEDEQRQHDITRGELERTRLVRDEALGSDAQLGANQPERRNGTNRSVACPR